MHLLAQATLGPDAHAVADQKHADHQLGIDRRAAGGTVERSEEPAHAGQIHKAIDQPEHVIAGDVVLQRELIEQRRLRLLSGTHHR